jgi:hypothetical protein
MNLSECLYCMNNKLPVEYTCGMTGNGGKVLVTITKVEDNGTTVHLPGGRKSVKPDVLCDITIASNLKMSKVNAEYLVGTWKR